MLVKVLLEGIFLNMYIFSVNTVSSKAANHWSGKTKEKNKRGHYILPVLEVLLWSVENKLQSRELEGDPIPLTKKNKNNCACKGTYRETRTKAEKLTKRGFSKVLTHFEQYLGIGLQKVNKKIEQFNFCEQC